MQQAFQRSSLVPSGFVVESAYYEGDKAVIAVRASGSVGLCPMTHQLVPISCGALIPALVDAAGYCARIRLAA